MLYSLLQLLLLRFHLDSIFVQFIELSLQGEDLFVFLIVIGVVGTHTSDNVLQILLLLLHID